MPSAALLFSAALNLSPMGLGGSGLWCRSMLQHLRLQPGYSLATVWLRRYAGRVHIASILRGLGLGPARNAEIGASFSLSFGVSTATRPTKGKKGAATLSSRRLALLLHCYKLSAVF